MKNDIFVEWENYAYFRSKELEALGKAIGAYNENKLTPHEYEDLWVLVHYYAKEAVGVYNKLADTEVMKRGYLVINRKDPDKC